MKNLFEDFNEAINDNLTVSDKEALAKIKKEPAGYDKNSESRFITGNHSILGDVEDSSGFYKMKKEEGDSVEKFSKKQHFVSLLASSLVPIAPIGAKEGQYFSKLVEEHEGFSEALQKNEALFALVQYVLFRDTDKPGNDRPNILGGVSFDFDYAHFNKQDFPNYERKLPLVIEKVNSIEKEDIQEMLRSLSNFKELISGAEGEKYLKKSEEVSGYTVTSPQQVQEVLLERIGELERILSKVTSAN